MTKAKKISLLVSVIIIVIGIIISATAGFNYGLSYGNSKRIVISMKDRFEINDYKSMTKEIFKNSIVETTSIFNDTVSIKVKEATDEQLDNLVTKVNEKYGYEYTRDDLQVTEVSNIKVFDILKQAIVPVLITLLIILAYMIIRYRKQGLVHIILNLFIPLILSEGLLLAIYAILRIPVTNILLPIVLMVYVASIIYSTKQCEA